MFFSGVYCCGYKYYRSKAMYRHVENREAWSTDHIRGRPEIFAPVLATFPFATAPNLSLLCLWAFIQVSSFSDLLPHENSHSISAQTSGNEEYFVIHSGRSEQFYSTRCFSFVFICVQSSVSVSIILLYEKKLHMHKHVTSVNNSLSLWLSSSS